MCHVVRPRDEQENDCCCVFVVEMGSSVGMATCCGVVGPGIESRCGGGSEIFHTRLKATVEPTQRTGYPISFALVTTHRLLASGLNNE